MGYLFVKTMFQNLSYRKSLPSSITDRTELKFNQSEIFYIIIKNIEGATFIVFQCRENVDNDNLCLYCRIKYGVIFVSRNHGLLYQTKFVPYAYKSMFDHTQEICFLDYNKKSCSKREQCIQRSNNISSYSRLGKPVFNYSLTYHTLRRIKCKFEL